MISLIVGLVILGVLLWAVESLIPLDPVVKRLIQVVVVVAVLVWIARAFGLI